MNVYIDYTNIYHSVLKRKKWPNIINGWETDNVEIVLNHYVTISLIVKIVISLKVQFK